jgi:hypothetical protein
MKQSRWGSFGESAANTFAGFFLSLGLQWLYFDWLLGFPLHITQNLFFAVVMTVVSLARGFTIRRIFEATGLRAKLSPFMQAVIAERRRQIEVEGWSLHHDDEHDIGMLAAAGATYAFYADQHLHHGIENWSKTSHPPMWPWPSEWWKPAGFRRDLVKAGALILAEGEKFDRTKSKRAT